MIKHIFLILLLLVGTLFAETDLRLNHYPKTIEWLQDADTNGESAYNIGVLYDDTIKDHKKAIEWYEKAYEMDDYQASGSSANNLGYIYDDLQKYEKAISWYKKSVDKKNKGASLNLGLLYKKAYEMGNIKGANALGYFYLNILLDKKNGIKLQQQKDILNLLIILEELIIEKRIT